MDEWMWELWYDGRLISDFVYVWNAMGTYVHQVITKLLYLLNQGETFTKVRIFCSDVLVESALSVFYPNASGRDSYECSDDDVGWG